MEVQQFVQQSPAELTRQSTLAAPTSSPLFTDSLTIDTQEEEAGYLIDSKGSTVKW